MRFNTEFGELRLPKAECISCIAQWRFQQCTACDFTEEMMRAGRDCFPHGLNSIEDMMFLKGCEKGMTFEEIDKAIKEALAHQSETLSDEEVQGLYAACARHSGSLEMLRKGGDDE